MVAIAWAAPAAAADEVAAAHYKKGRSLYNVSEYRAALDEFKQAYVAHEDPAFLYNIAQCHRQLGNHREAITFYKRFLKESPGARNRKEIEQLISELEAKAAAAPPPAPAAEAGPPPASAPPPTPPQPVPAQAPEPTVAVTPEPVAPEGHAGLHLEVALGGGGLHDDFNWLQVSNGTATGGSGAFQVAVTYGLSRRFALGGLLAAESVQSPKVMTGGTTNDNVSVGAVGLLGVAGDLRLVPGPTGWHFEGAIGAARMSIKDKSGVLSSISPAGGGLVLAAGYDWALGPNWQLGVLGRFLGASMSDQGYKHDVTAGSLLLCIGRH